MRQGPDRGARDNAGPAEAVGVRTARGDHGPSGRPGTERVTLHRVELNGRVAEQGTLEELAFAGYGHFTSMQVRGHRVRGLDLHLERLRRDSRELFGRAVDGRRVLGYLRQATDCCSWTATASCPRDRSGTCACSTASGSCGRPGPARDHQQLVQAGLARDGVPSATRPVHRDDLGRFRSAVLMNSIVPGRPLAAIDGVELAGERSCWTWSGAPTWPARSSPPDDGGSAIAGGSRFATVCWSLPVPGRQRAVLDP